MGGGVDGDGDIWDNNNYEEMMDWCMLEWICDSQECAFLIFHKCVGILCIGFHRGCVCSQAPRRAPAIPRRRRGGEICRAICNSVVVLVVINVLVVAIVVLIVVIVVVIV